MKATCESDSHRDTAQTESGWTPAPADLRPVIGHQVRFGANGAVRVGRLRDDMSTICLDNGSIVRVQGSLEVLDLDALEPYDRWLRSKVAVGKGAKDRRMLDHDRIRPRAKAHQRDIIGWAYAKERAGIFASFGLGKTLMQLELLRLLLEDDGGAALQVAPLGVHEEFFEEAELLGVQLHRIRSTAEAKDGCVNLTHYEAVRDGKVAPRAFSASSLDEAAVLRGMGSTETFRSFMNLFEGLRHKYVATATPSPNDILEIAAYSAYLEVLDVADIKTRYFQRNSEKADDLTLIEGRELDFWHWLASWALFIESPEDLGHDGSEYLLPDIQVTWHQVEDPEGFTAWDRGGQALLVPDSQVGVSDAARLKRETIGARMERLREIVGAEPNERFLLWHDLERERQAILKAFPEAVDIHGSMPIEERERRIRQFKAGECRLFATKPRISGAGCNFQQVCSRAVFLGVTFKAYDVIQAVRRIHRFMQSETVHIHFIYARSEDAVRRSLERKWAEDVKLRATMSEIVREHGLSRLALSESLQRESRVTRREASGAGWRSICNDSVRELRTMEDCSVGLALFSPPFAGMYQYASHVADMSFVDDNAHFWRGMDFHTPELFRVLQPGRVAVVHAKDRVVPGNLSGLGFGTIYPFSDACVAHYQKHGFGFLARVTIATDVVRENNGTYRLGYTEKMRDATKTGHGLPEYLLIFRKPPSSNENAYADEPVTKEGPRCLVDGEEVSYRRGARIIPGTGWSLAEWQILASGFWRSNGNRIATTEELATYQGHQIYRAWRRECSSGIYDYHRHVTLCEAVQEAGRLPVDFCLMPPHAAKNDGAVWSDIARMRTLNMVQRQKGREMHLCPLQFDIAERAIDLFSSPGDVVLDPFAGLGTVPMMAARMGREGVGIELSEDYWRDGLAHLQAEDAKLRQMSLFDLLGAPQERSRLPESP